jgi:uncharacterized protein (TIGR00299 family) protein
MKIAYFDCSSGIAGNMIIGALLDAGLSKEYLLKELLKILNPKLVPCEVEGSEFRNKYEIIISKTTRGGISGTYFDVKLHGKDKHRSLQDILKIIKKSKLSEDVKELSSRIFKRLAEAEAKVHAIPINKVHFHEVGAIDSIIDIVGTAIGLEKLGIQKVYGSPLPIGTGIIKCAHGTLPVPAPATAQLLKGVTIYSAGVKGELVTPTGAAIITTIASSFGDIPKIKLEASGSGAGSKIYPSLPNMLKVFIGESLVPSERDTIIQIETNIDDMEPKSFDRVIKGMMKVGALDAYTIPVRMKKKREGKNLVILCRPENRELIITRIFELTTTFGVRVYLIPREKLSRRFKTIKTKYGKVKIKVGSLGKEVKTVAPEFEDYKHLAKKHSIPIKKAYRALTYSLTRPA